MAWLPRGTITLARGASLSVRKRIIRSGRDLRCLAFRRQYGWAAIRRQERTGAPGFTAGRLPPRRWPWIGSEAKPPPDRLRRRKVVVPRTSSQEQRHDNV